MPEKEKVLFSTLSGHFPGPSRRNWTSQPAFSGRFRPNKEKVLFSIFRHFFDPLHGQIALATRQIPVVLGQIKRKFYFPHFSGGFPAPSRPFCTSQPAFSGRFRPNKKESFIFDFPHFSGPPHGVIGLATRQIPVVLGQRKEKVLFSIFRTFPAIFRPPHGVIGRGG